MQMGACLRKDKEIKKQKIGKDWEEIIKNTWGGPEKNDITSAKERESFRRSLSNLEITKREITVLGDWESMRNLSFYTMDGKEPSYKHEGMCGKLRP